MTEQMPRITFVQSPKRKRGLVIQGMRFQFVSIQEDLFFGIAERKINEKKFQVTDREKTLIDCADRPDLSGGMIQLSQVLESETTKIDWGRIEDYFERWGAEPW